jgi:putative DNA primase/helicase
MHIQSDRAHAPYTFADWQAGKRPKKGWDCADAVDDGWSAPELDAFMRATARPWSPPQQKPAGEPAESVRPAAAPVKPAGPSSPVREARTVEQAQPAPLAASDNDNGSPAPRVKPRIAVVKGEIHRAVDQAIAVLSDQTLGIFARADELVRAVTHFTPTQTLTVAKQGENVSRPDGSVIVTTLTEAALVEALTERALFVKFNLRVNDFVPCDCPPEVAKMVLARKGHNWTMPRLRAVISAPTLRPDGTVISEPGYDAETGLLLVGDRLWRQVPDSPSKREATEALAVLSEPIAAIPFVAESDRAAALALLITSVMRPSLKTAPMFAVSAPSAGTGKSLVVDVAAVMATGRRAAVVTPTPDEAELEKRIGACALAGDQILSIDNVTHILRSDQLCQMLTQDEVQVRVLGSSKNVRIPATSLICATGNNLTVFGDLNRRTIQIRLDAKTERPEERHFEFDAIDLAMRKRPELVAAVLTIMRAYLSASAPNRASPMGGFEAWSDLVRSSLMWLGLADCRGDVAAQRAADPEKDELAEIIDALPMGPFTTKEIALKVAESPALKEALATFIDRGGVFSSKRFGRYLARYASTRIGKRWIEQLPRDSNSNSSVWRVSGDNHNDPKSVDQGPEFGGW